MMEEFVTVKDKKFYCCVCGAYKLKVRDGAESQEDVKVICVGCLKIMEKMKKEIAKRKKLEPDVKKWKQTHEMVEEGKKRFGDEDAFESFGIKNPFNKK